MAVGAWARLGVWIDRGLVAGGLLLLFISQKHRIAGDGVARYASLRLLFEDGVVADFPYSMVGPLFASPLYWLDRYVGPPLWWSGRYNFFVFLLGLLALHRLLRPHLEPAAIRKFVLLLVAASMFGRHQMDFYGEVFSAVLAGAGLLSLAAGGNRWAWAALLLAVVNTPATLVGLGLAAVGATLIHRRWRFLVLPLGAAALVLAESWLRRGSPFLTGYEDNVGFETVLPYSGQPGFSFPFFFGLLSILFSFGKGLAFFAPGLVLPVRQRMQRRHPALWHGYLLWLLFLAGMVLVYAQWWSWYGGWYWGPRFFLFASLPASLALAVTLIDRPSSVSAGLVSLTVLALSVLVGVTGVVFELHGLDLCTSDALALEALCWYVPEFSGLFHPFVAAKPLVPEDWLFLSHAGAVLLRLGLPVARDVVTGTAAAAKDAGERLSGRMRF
jgi:hypothetical protein